MVYLKEVLGLREWTPTGQLQLGHIPVDGSNPFPNNSSKKKLHGFGSLLLQSGHIPPTCLRPARTRSST